MGVVKSLADNELLRVDGMQLPQFSNYLAVIATKQPQRIPDLLTYQTLFIESQMEHGGDEWASFPSRLVVTCKAYWIWSL